MKLNSYLIPDTKINSKWIKDLNIKAKNYKTLQRKYKPSWSWIWQWFLKYDTQSTSNNRKNKLDFIKFQNFYAPKNTIKKVKRDIQAHEKMLNIINHQGNTN